MRPQTIRATLAILVVGVFMGITATMAIFPLFSKRNVELDSYANFFLKTASVYAGIVGVIVGYYFGRDSDRRRLNQREPPPSSADDEPLASTSTLRTGG
jgi:hypothetical protein